VHLPPITVIASHLSRRHIFRAAAAAAAAKYVAHAKSACTETHTVSLAARAWTVTRRVFARRTSAELSAITRRFVCAWGEVTSQNLRPRYDRHFQSINQSGIA